MRPKITVLVAARKDSKYLAKFLHNYANKTIEDGSIELLVMMSAQDTWNKEIVTDFMDRGVRFFEENKGWGRNGLHLYYEMMMPFANGDWVIYFCEDHNIVQYGWNKIIEQVISGRKLDASSPYVLVPGWDNTGSMNHVLSRGYIDAVGISHHGNLDSYINHVSPMIPGNHIVPLPVLFHDFTHDGDLMDPENSRVKLSEEGMALPAWDSPEVRGWIQKDADKLNVVIRSYK